MSNINSYKEFLNNLFKQIESYNIKFCILRNYEELPEKIGHDLDMLIESGKTKNIIKILKKNAEELNWNYGETIDRVGCITIYFYKIFKGEFKVLYFDLVEDFTWNGNHLLEGETILNERKQFKNFYIPSLKYEFIIKLMVRILHSGKIKSEYIPEYIKNYNLLGKKEIEQVLEKMFSKESKEKILEALENKDYSLLEKNYKLFRRGIKKKYNIKSYKLKLKALITLVNRIIFTKGKVIAFLGTDGSGKSTLIDEIKPELEKIYSGKVVYEHWRPNFLPPLRKVVKKEKKIDTSSPHAEKSYSTVTSLVKLLYYTMDFYFGYLLKIMPLKIKFNIIIFDRYYYDFYVDQIRYRLNLPKIIFKLFELFIPKPDVTFILTGDSEILYQRKKEISKSEIERQNQILLSLEKRLKRAVVIKTDGKIEKSKIKIIEKIFN